MLESNCKSVVRFLASLFLSVFLAACVHNQCITGKWREPGKTSSIELRQDGTFTATDDMGMTVNGNYTIEAAAGIRFEIIHPDSSVEIISGSITVQGDELLLTHEGDKEVLLYRRMK